MTRGSAESAFCSSAGAGDASSNGSKHGLPLVARRGWAERKRGFDRLARESKVKWRILYKRANAWYTVSKLNEGEALELL